MASNEGSVVATFCDDGSVLVESYDVAGENVGVRVIPSPDVCSDPACSKNGRCPTCGFVA